MITTQQKYQQTYIISDTDILFWESENVNKADNKPTLLQLLANTSSRQQGTI